MNASTEFQEGFALIFASALASGRTMVTSSTNILYTFPISTTEANSISRTVHNQMPVIRDDFAASQWLDPVFTTANMLSFLLQPCSSEWIEAYAVSTLVNNPANDSAECIRGV